MKCEENMKKVILITGASSGIGEATARYLSELGYVLVLTARNKEKLLKIVSELPTKAYSYSFDLLKMKEISSIFEFCNENNLKLDGLVHCAGINQDMPVRTNDVDVMETVTQLNYEVFIELGKHFYKKKYSNDGSSIIAISSYASIRSSAGMCTYASSKAALNMAVKVMAKEFIKRKIRVNAVLPAFVNTAMAVQAQDYIESMEEKMKNQFMGIIDPIQVAYLIEYLLSDKAKYITEALLPISGGA